MKHVYAAKDFDPKKSALFCQHVLECDHVIVWENVKILKSEPLVTNRRVAESFLTNQNAEECNVLNLVNNNVNE